MKPSTIERHYPTSRALCEAVLADAGPTVLLSFSAGKDAVASWLQLRELGFTRIVPFYLYLVPGLEFVEQGLRYYEEFFQTPILRLPDPSTNRMLQALVFQPPERAALLETIKIPRLTVEHLDQHVRAVAGAPDAYVAIGNRAADSPIRLANIRRYGSVNPGRRSFLPIYDWRVADLRKSLLAARVRLTVDYQLFGRSFDGIDWRFMAPIKEHYPDDYARILEFFPLANLEIMRRNLRRPS